MESPSSSITYSDVPQGYTVKSSPSTSSYSDVPEGYTIKESSGANSGIISRIGEDWDKRKAMGEEAADAYVAGKESKPAALYDITGKTMFGGAGDVAKEVGKSVGSTVSELTPDFIAKPVGQAASYMGSEIMKTPEGQAGLIALKSGEAGWNNFKENHPEAARHIESTFDIAGALSGAKAFTAIDAAAAGGSLEKAGKDLYEKGEKQAIEKKEKFFQDLVLPKETKSVREDQVRRTTEKGILKQKVVEPTDEEKKMAKYAGEVPGVSPRNSLQGNYNIIAKANKAEAERLQALLKKNDVTINFEDVQKTLADASNKALENPSVSVAKEPSQLVIHGFNKAVLDNAIKNGGQITASGLLQARKDFDAWLKDVKPNHFDAAVENTKSITADYLRTGLNDLIESKMPNEAYKASLTRQYNLYKVMRNLEKKIPDEGKNILTQAVQKAEDKIPGKGIVKDAALTASIMSHPVASAAIGTGIGALKAVNSPTAKKFLGYGMQKAGQGIKRAGEPIINTGTPIESVQP